MYERFYDFRLEDQPVGYFTVRDDGREISMNVVFEVEGRVIENPFALRYEGERTIQYRIGDGEWTDEGLISPEHYPTSAYPILLEMMRGPMTYVAVSEADGAEIGVTSLVRDGETVREIREERMVREFRMRDGIPYRIDWGGAVSTLCDSLEDAVRGTRLEHVA